MQIGQVAARTELSIRTIRHYDETGLVTPSARSAGGFRLYTEPDVQRLLFIRRMKTLNLTLAEMKDLLGALDTLKDDGAGAAERSAATETLHRFQARTEEAIGQLRKYLGLAEEFAESLAEYTR
ncbi:MerR family transcriptional regulator [Mycobacterium sp. TNTM28]|uniref:MerR family transcriptional regulator n=1 Tax=[Mycobacterium] fortunisiensis TaxID=2600579 RepID=A0ABS6KT09_9MYCO|nr:MerR family transcriptional regulator [[Mycobacterium] fortunisiensis]MBU9766711.1 MerR family transcriptional regulator [[Mycobacterium] fortunisiensis]